MSEANKHLPPDLRSSGIGGGARENRRSAAAHSAAMAASHSRPTENEKADQAEAETTKTKDVEKSKCDRCSREVTEDDNFCGRCGADLLNDPAKRLGITFVPEDFDEYLFRGFLAKEVKVVGKSMVIRSSVAQDHKKISDYLMENWSEKPVAPDFWDNLRGTAAISMALMSFDGHPIPDDVKESVDWLMQRGSALHDMITQRVVLFNRAVTAWLREKDTFLVS